jgi:hypothetical protein
MSRRALRRFLAVATLGIFGYGFNALSMASAAGDSDPGFDLRSGQEVTFAVTIVGGKVAVGAPRASKLGAAQPKDGEITIGLGARDKSCTNPSSSPR